MSQQIENQKDETANTDLAKFMINSEFDISGSTRKVGSNN